MIGGNGRNQFRQYAGQNAGNLNGYNAIQNVKNHVVQNPRVQNDRIQNQNGNDNLVAVQEYDLMAAAADLDEIEEVNANCILMAYENCYNNEIFNMFTQEEQYTELLEPIPESYQVPQNDNEVISEVTGVEQGGETVEQHSANFEETHALFESLYHNLAVEVEKVNSVNRKLKETNADLTTELT
nr:hypothetical protein [Tanacetum cinerariifolium]